VRTLSSTLTSAQKSTRLDVLVKIQLTQGANDYTYTRTRILSITHTEEPYSQTATVILDNHDGALTALDFKGYKGVLSYGLITSAGEEYSACAPLYVVGQQLNSFPGGLTCSLSLAGIPNLLDADRSVGRDGYAYTPTTASLKTAKDTFTEIVKAVLPSRANSTAYSLGDLVIPAVSNDYTYKCTVAGTTASSAPTWPTSTGDTVVDGTVTWKNMGVELIGFRLTPAYTPTFDSEDSLIDVFMPKDSFQINVDGSRLEALKTLLGYTKCVMRVEADGGVHIFVPTTTGVSYDYEYKLAVADEHNFFSKSVRTGLVIPNFIRVLNHPDHEDQFSGSANDASSFALVPKYQTNYYRVASDAQATAIAEAILARLQLEAASASASVLMNVGAEVYDYVKVTDSRENDTKVGNIGVLTRHYRPGQSQPWSMDFRFGRVAAGGLMGTLLSDDFEADWDAAYDKLRDAINQIWEYLRAREETVPKLHVTKQLIIPVVPP